MKKVSVIGSTGSIGTQALQVIESFPEEFSAYSLAAGNNVDLLRQQIIKFTPTLVSVKEEAHIAELQKEFPKIKFFHGQEGLVETCVAKEVDVVVMGVVGFAALEPTLAAIRSDKKIAIANKEVLVTGGNLLKKEIEKSNAQVIPVDSEHSALFQLLENRPRNSISSIVLTASGGPLLRSPEIALKDVTPEIAVKHPNWSMGAKISVDSATMMNKGLELIEAHYLFDFPQDKIEVWVHPQSLVHGAIWTTDNSCLAQLNKPDMRLSIAYAMYYPNRLDQVIPKLSFSEMAMLEFLPPNGDRFPCLDLARLALEKSQSHVIHLNAANEVLVHAFLEKKIRFDQIAQGIRERLEEHTAAPIESIEDIFRADEAARSATESWILKLAERTN